ncbi:helix-turn-helix domain-containing protein [Natronococcus occultus]|uniref:helix-turn-helix domain-containing protein n=1 Tax=Natronococcus occultus TaxID=29288 RepID=UPI000A477671|nr:helix-turn-helix domain-containing protein [Natronococcus occultus]
MPISIDEFDEYESRDQHDTNARRVVRFLAENHEQAFKATEIAEATEVNENSIQPVLNRLRSRGLVRHKQPYWAIGDLERVRNAFVFRSTTEFLDEKLGTESREDWLTAAKADDE